MMSLKVISDQVKCLIVDDEPLAADLVKSYVETVEELKLIGVCHNAFDALTLIRRHQIDLVFLDIRMPKLTGLGLIKTLKNPPKIIITTAYREFAVEGFELDVADYLVKPISLERFYKALGKVLQKNNDPEQPIITREEEPFVYFKVDREMVRVNLNEILWIESMKDYIKIFLEGKKSLITLQGISYTEEKLPSSLFLRIHRSYIISRRKVTAFGVDSVRLGDKLLPIGKSYKQTVQNELHDIIK